MILWDKMLYITTRLICVLQSCKSSQQLG